MHVGLLNAQMAAGREGVSTAPSPRLVQAAHEFEGQMMKELLKPMIGQNALTGESDDDDSGSGAILGEFGAESLGRALSQQGGFGIADQIVKELSHFGNHSNIGKVAGNDGKQRSERLERFGTKLDK